MADGIVWILRTSEPWRDVPERYGNWNSVIVRLTADRKHPAAGNYGGAPASQRIET